MIVVFERVGRNPIWSAPFRTHHSLTVVAFCTMTMVLGCSQSPEIENTVRLNVDDPKTVGCQTIEPDQTWIKELAKIPRSSAWLDPESIEVTKMQFSGSPDSITVRLHWTGYRDEKWYQDCRERERERQQEAALLYTEEHLQRLRETWGVDPEPCKKKAIYEERTVATVRPRILENCVFSSPFHPSR